MAHRCKNHLRLERDESGALSDRELWLSVPGEQTPVKHRDMWFKKRLHLFQRIWYMSWFIEALFCYDMGADRLGQLPPNNSIWVDKAKWAVSFVSGKPIFRLSCLNTLARTVVGRTLGTVVYRRLAYSAYAVLGRDISLEVTDGYIILMGKAEVGKPAECVNTIPVAQIDMPRMDDESSVASSSSTIPDLSHLQCAQPVGYRVGDLRTLDLPSGRSVDPQPFIVQGLHLPQECQLCDRIRISLPDAESLSFQDKVGIYLLHLKRSGCLRM